MDYEPKIGDFVWAQMKSYKPWPARVIEPEKAKKGFKWVYFFGSENFGWIEDYNIKPFHVYEEKFKDQYKSLIFKASLTQIKDYIKWKEEDPEFEKNFLEEIKEKRKHKPSPRKSTSKKRQSTDGSTTPNQSTKKAKTSNIGGDSQLNTSTLSNTESDTANSFEQTPNVVDTSINENGTASIPFTDEIEDLPPIFNKDSATSSTMLDVIKNTMKNKNIVASKLSFGFIGLGIMGSAIVKNLITSGHKVNLYNRTPERCEEIKAQADANNASSKVQIYLTPTDVVQNSDIIFSCLADPISARRIVTDNCGVTHGLESGTGLKNKGYVEMASIDPGTSQDIASVINDKGGRYLEAQLQGSRRQAEEGNLIVLAAGDQSLFVDCQSCFKAMGKTAFFLGNIGCATKMNLYINMAMGIGLAGLAESMILAERSGLSMTDFLEIFGMSEGASKYLMNKGKQIKDRRFRDVEEAIKYMQKDIKLCLDISDGLKQNVPVAAAVNEVYKTARRFGYDDYDVCGVFMKMRH